MIRDITLGQYYPGGSMIHKLDARTKIIATMVYIVAVFVVKDFLGFAMLLLALAFAIAASRVPLKFILRGLKPIFFLIAFTFLLNMFMVQGDPIFEWGILHITRQGLRTAVFMALRLTFLIIGASLLTLTTKPIHLTDGIESLLSPLNKVGVPAHDLAMMMTIALRFIPTLLEELDKIMKAQQARGADFETGNILRRAKALVPILVPLFISAFRIAQDLAMAMESRCYGSNFKRTRMNAMSMGRADAVSFIALAIFMGIIIAERVLI